MIRMIHRATHHDPCEMFVYVYMHVYMYKDHTTWHHGMQLYRTPTHPGVTWLTGSLSQRSQLRVPCIMGVHIHHVCICVLCMRFTIYMYICMMYLCCKTYGSRWSHHRLVALALCLVVWHCALLATSLYLASRITMSHIVERSTPAALPASTYMDGTILTNLAQHNNNMMKTVVDRVAEPVEFRFCTVCSGSEIFVLAMASLMHMYNQMGIAVTFIYTFGCDNKASVQEWMIRLLSLIANGLPGISLVIEPGCLFENAEDLGQDMAHCKKHGKPCPVPSSDLCAAGTSCKDFSRASSSYEKGTNISDMQTSVGGSADTLHGLLGYLARHLVSIIVWENVENVDEDIDSSEKAAKTHLDNIRDKYHRLGYASLPFITDAHLFGYYLHSATSNIFGMCMGY